MKSRIRSLIKRIPVLGKPYAQREELRAIVQKLWEPPGHFYSPIPDLDDIRRRDEVIFDARSAEVPGIELRQSAQLDLLQSFTRFYRDLPFPVRERAGSRYRFENNAFSYFDAIVFYCMIRQLRPRRVIEVGSGFSSCALLDTNQQFFDSSISCTFIEPYPDLLLSLLQDGDRERTTLIARNLQDVNPDIFAHLSADDVFFVDSSHVVKTDSDVNFVFFEILPRLQSGVYIHFHDIFFPFEYPREWVYQGRAWNEAYMLRAFLQHNARYQIEFFNSFMEMFHRDIIARDMPMCLRYAQQSMIDTSAQSIWLKKL